jgi:hypothetical protein
MDGRDDRRPAWVIPLALVTVVAGIVVVSAVAPNLVHRDDLGPEPSIPAATTTAATELAPGWEDLGASPIPSDNVVEVDAGTELIVLNGGMNRSSIPGPYCGPLCRWVVAAIDHETGDIRTLPESPMCDEGTPAGVWTDDELIVWSSSPIDHGCPVAASYSPEADRWRALDSDFFRDAGSQVVWTGQELISTAGLAYRPDTSETRRVPAVDESPMFTGGAVGSPPLVHWTGKVVLALGSEGVIMADPDGGITNGPDPPIPEFGRTSVWTGDGLLAVSGDMEAALFDPATDRWQGVDSVPLPSECWPGPEWSAGGGLAFIEGCGYGIGVWDGSGDWKLLPEATYFSGGSGQTSGAFLYQLGSRILRYRLPELVDGEFPQPGFLPVGSQYLDVPAGWHVTHAYRDPADSVEEGRQAVGVEVTAPGGVACRVESTFPGVNPYVPAFTEPAMLKRDRDRVEIPVGETASGQDGLAHVVIDGPGVVDVVCPDLDGARTLAAHLWSPNATPGALPAGVAGDTTCYVEPQIVARPGSDSTDIVVQLELLNPEPCAAQELAVDFGESSASIVGSPRQVDLHRTLTPDQPYLIAHYRLRNWCSDPLVARAVVDNHFQTFALNVTAPCLQEGLFPTFVFTDLEGPTARPALQP